MNIYTKQNVYNELQSAGVELDHHESDLYAKKDANSAAIIENYKYKRNVTTFRSQVDGLIWYDIPFAFIPFWKNKQAAV